MVDPFIGTGGRPAVAGGTGPGLTGPVEPAPVDPATVMATWGRDDPGIGPGTVGASS
jgi:hypothetical protein